MKKIFFICILLFTYNIFAIPNRYKTFTKQSIYDFIKNRDNKEALIGYISLFRDSAIRNKSGKKVFETYNLIIYHLSVFDIENSSEELDNIMLNSIESIKMFTNDAYNVCINIGRNAYYTY